MHSTLWENCLKSLEGEIPEQQLNTWIRPLHASESNGELRLLAPNRFVLDWVKEHYLNTITQVLKKLSAPGTELPALQLDIGSVQTPANPILQPVDSKRITGQKSPGCYRFQGSALNPRFTFEAFVGGKSNELARAASLQVCDFPGSTYNPLFIYGGVGLGKTHLMHAIGNQLHQKTPNARIVYLHSERFVADMVKALQHNTINDFKQSYRYADALLIDDIQFLAGKERSQEEFFHTFNTLLESQQQVVLTCDRYPKEVDGLEDRLKSRFGWGLTVAIDPPELETRVAILKNKAALSQVVLNDDVAFFIARQIQSNVRELEGSLRRVIANSSFTGRPISVEFARETLRDLIALQDRLVSIDNIQKTVAEYYKIRVSDMHSKRRNRSISRPRQMAMALAKTLTSQSLPEIGEAFGGRDHTTVLHACRKIESLRESDSRIREDYQNLLRTFNS